MPHTLVSALLPFQLPQIPLPKLIMSLLLTGHPSHCCPHRGTCDRACILCMTSKMVLESAWTSPPPHSIYPTLVPVLTVSSLFTGHPSHCWCRTGTCVSACIPCLTSKMVLEPEYLSLYSCLSSVSIMHSSKDLDSLSVKLTLEWNFSKIKKIKCRWFNKGALNLSSRMPSVPRHYWSCSKNCQTPLTKKKKKKKKTLANSAYG